MLFLLRPPTKPCYCDVMMHNIFFRGRKVKHSDKSVLPLTEKERKGKWKWTTGLRMKNGCANLCSFWAQTNGWSCVLKLLFKKLLCSPRFLGSIISYFPPLFRLTTHSPLSEKLPAITHVLLFQTARKMMSRRCCFVWRLSAKNTIVYYSLGRQSPDD